MLRALVPIATDLMSLTPFLRSDQTASHGFTASEIRAQ